LPALTQSNSTVLELTLRDPQRTALHGCMQLTNASKDFRLDKCARTDETLIARALPPGQYSLWITSDGFNPQSSTLDVRSGERKVLPIALSVANVNTEVRVEAASTLLDPNGSSDQRLSARTISHLPAALPRRDVVNAVQTQPSWVLKTNSVLHPRGSEYD